jgi:subtilisin family serine protease
MRSGLAVANLPDAAVEALQRNPRIAGIERDGIVTADGSGTQSGATWGIDRIDQRSLPLSTTYSWEGDGTGVTAYIIDTGIRTTHNEFGGRASGGFTSISDGNGTDDCYGHGTRRRHRRRRDVRRRGRQSRRRASSRLQRRARSGVIAGVDWVTGNHAANAVAGMSLGGVSSALDNAVTNSINSGVTYAVAAGNSNADACNSSPARTAAALTVGATTSGDAKASFSNYGSCVDINAPGVSITSAWNTSNTATNTISGTSMATPHVTGAAASYLSAGHLGSSPAAVTSALKTVASTGHLTGLVGSTPNLLLFVGFSQGAESGGGGGSAPVARLQKTCNGRSCTFTSTSTGTIDSYLWTFTGGDRPSPQTGTGPYLVNYQARESGSVTLKVTNGNGFTSTTVRFMQPGQVPSCLTLQSKEVKGVRVV